MKNIWEICKFSDEVVYGDLDVSKFAVELHSVLDGTADKNYSDPKLFLDNSFLTSSAKVMLKDSLVRIGRGTGQPVYIIDTGFGGGKTHTLILLYHFFKNRELSKGYLKKYNLDNEYGILEVPEANVVAIDCRRLKRNTLWGEIAYSVGKYDEIREYDQNKQQIKDIEIVKSFFKKPTLILIDELPHYLISADAEKIGNVTLADLTIAFIMNLISAISSSKNTILIMTLTAKQQLYEKYTGKIRESLKNLGDFRVDVLVDDFKEGLSRQVQFKTPVDKREIYEVIKTRLIRNFNEQEKDIVVESFNDYFQTKGMITDPDFKSTFSKSYPFHPFLIDTLYERVSSIDKFNQTRGMLRLLALVLHNIYKNQLDCKIVSTSDIQLNDNEISEELTSRIDRGEFKRVIEDDCIKKAKQLDEKRNIKIIEKISRTIYLYSLIGSTKISGIKPSDISMAVCEPGLDPSLIDDALNEMDRQFWYLKRNGVEYYFDKEPQLNKIIYDYMLEIRPREIKNKLKETLVTLFPSKGAEVVIWDKTKLEDNENLKIFVLDYDEKIDYDNRNLLKPLLEYKSDGGIRDYQNTIIFVFADEYGIESIQENARMVCAIRNAQKDSRIIHGGNAQTVKLRLQESERTLTSECLRVYSRICYPNSNEIKFDTISQIDIKDYSITEAILNLLSRKGKLIMDNLSPDILDDNLNTVLKIEELYALFKKDKSKKFLINGKVIMDAVRLGIRNGIFGYADNLEKYEDKYSAVVGKEVDPTWRGYIIKKGLIYQDTQFRNSEEVNIHQTKSDNKIVDPIKNNDFGYTYRIDFNDPKEIISVLEKYPIISVGGKISAKFEIELNNDTDSIIIKSQLKQSHEIKSLVQSLLNTNRFTGLGNLIIESDHDLANDFITYKINAKKV